MTELISWLATLLSVIGVILNARKKVSGFYYWSVANVCWIVINFSQAMYAQAALFVFYFGVCIYGIRAWRQGGDDGAL